MSAYKYGLWYLELATTLPLSLQIIQVDNEHNKQFLQDHLPSEVNTEKYRTVAPSRKKDGTNNRSENSSFRTKQVGTANNYRPY